MYMKIPSKNVPFIEVNNLIERNAIPNRLRVEGMRFVYVKDMDVQKFYYLKGGITNSNWVELGSGGGSSSNNFGQVQDISNLNDIGAIEGYLMMVVNANTIYEFHDTTESDNFQPDGVMIVSGIDDGRWVGIAGRHAYWGNNIKRIGVADTNFSDSSYYPIDLQAKSRLNGKFSYIIANYGEYSKILFWEFITESDGRYKDMRFDTIQDVDYFINNTLISKNGDYINESFQVKIYLRQTTVGESLNKIVNYNGLISKLKSGKKLQERNFCTLMNISGYNEHQFVDYFINLIYDEWMGFDIPLGVKNTIGIPINYNKLYDLIPTKFAKGRKYYFNYQNKRERHVYDSITNTTLIIEDAPINNELYYLESMVIAENDGDTRLPEYIPFSLLGEDPRIDEIWDSYSSVRVYCLVDNLINPRYYYFMIKPIGVDQFIIPYTSEITEGTPLKCGVIFTNRTMLKVMPNIAENEVDVKNNSNKSFWFKRNDLTLFKNHMISGDKGKRGDSLEFRFFVYDDTTGLCSQFTEQFNLDFRVTGTPIKIMPNRKIRNNK